MEVSWNDYDVLMTRYLDVCNRALVLNSDRFPFKQILGSATQSGKGAVVEVNIVDTLPPVSYAMTLGYNGIEAKPHGDCEDCRCDRSWAVSKSYLEDVVMHPDVYIQNPAKINWEWMYDA